VVGRSDSSSLASVTHLPARTVPDLLRALLTADPGRPRLTWYGADGDRVELSARTLENWVAKTANLLVEEFDAGPGTRVCVRLPAHWRTVTWVLAAWSAGACVVVPAGGASAPVPDPEPDVVVTADPAAAVAAGVQPDRLVAVALPALATSFGLGLPEGALDGAAEVRTHGDVFVPLVAPAPADDALAVADADPVGHGRLLAAAAEAGLPDRPRVLTDAGPDRAVEAWLAPLAADGSVVLVAPGVAADDPGLVHRIAAQEQVDLRLT
jgi:uncharacterized protein (TIGR03089 family)